MCSAFNFLHGLLIVFLGGFGQVFTVFSGVNDEKAPMARCMTGAMCGLQGANPLVG
jgi:hypothetical protein